MIFFFNPTQNNCTPLEIAEQNASHECTRVLKEFTNNNRQLHNDRQSSIQAPVLTASDKEELEEIISNIIDLKIRKQRAAGGHHRSAPTTPIIKTHRHHHHTRAASTSVQCNENRPLHDRKFSRDEPSSHTIDSATQTKISSTAHRHLSPAVDSFKKPDHLAGQSTKAVTFSPFNKTKFITPPTTNNSVFNDSDCSKNIGNNIMLPANVMEELSTKLNRQRERQRRSEINTPMHSHHGHVTANSKNKTTHGKITRQGRESKYRKQIIEKYRKK
jgi:hypothetical protein